MMLFLSFNFNLISPNFLKSDSNFGISGFIIFNFLDLKTFKNPPVVFLVTCAAFVGFTFPVFLDGVFAAFTSHVFLDGVFAAFTFPVFLDGVFAAFTFPVFLETAFADFTST